MAAKTTGMLVRNDNCIGCGACQTACREQNGFAADETWLELVRGEAKFVDGKMRMSHVLAPVIDKCKICVEKNPAPLCAVICPTKCLFVGDASELVDFMQAQPKGTYQLMV